MELACPGFTAFNVGSNFEVPEEIHEYFSLQAPPNTSIWRKPSASDNANAPMILKRLRDPFFLAEVTVSADFAEEFDQAGLVIFTGSLPDPSIMRSPVAIRRGNLYSRPGAEAPTSGRWAKACLEFAAGELHAASVVATSSCGADWTSSARLSSSMTADPYSLTSQSLRIKFERVGESLYVWYHDPSLNHSPQMELHRSSTFESHHRSPEDVGSGWKKMREVMGFFSGAEQKGNIWVGCYASRPMEFERSSGWGQVDGLIAEFEDLEILPFTE